MNSINNISGLITSSNFFKPVLGVALLGMICMLARKIFPEDGEVLMTQPSVNKFYLREGWVSYTPKGHYLPSWYKVSLSSYRFKCSWELNFYSCGSDFESDGGYLDVRNYIDEFPRVIQKEGQLQLVAKEQPSEEGKQGEVKILSEKKLQMKRFAIVL